MSIAALILVAFLAPAAPAIACTRVGGVAVGQCRRPPSSPSNSSSTKATPETLLLRMLNEERTSRGLRPLRTDQRARVIAEEHARRMARRGKIYHNPELSTAEGRSRLGSPSAVGENVGVGPSARAVHTAFMKSHRHKRNILYRSYRHVGLGAVWRGGSLYVVEVFISRSSGGSAAPPFLSRPERNAARTAGSFGRVVSAKPGVRAASDEIRGMPVGTPTLSGARSASLLGSLAGPNSRSGDGVQAAAAGIAFLGLGFGLLLRRRGQIARSRA